MEAGPREGGWGGGEAGGGAEVRQAVVDGRDGGTVLHHSQSETRE